MNVYLFATVLGLLGLIMMSIMGLAHSAGGHSHSHSGHGHAGHGQAGHGHAGSGAHGSSASTSSTTHGAGTHSTTGAHSLKLETRGDGHALAPGHLHPDGSWLLALASPRVLLSLSLGFGLTGLTMQSVLPALLVLPLAILGAVLLEALLIRPYWGFLMRFESAPSLTLSSAVGSPARAASDFGSDGAGVIMFELNGESRQLLAHFNGPGPAVRRGEALSVESVDEQSNRCTVRRT